MHWPEALVFLVCACVVNLSVQEPFMDEFFHFTQTLTYAQGNFDVWNPKITTLPGLYILAAPFVWLSESLYSWLPVSGLVVCRALNVGLSLCNLSLLKSLSSSPDLGALLFSFPPLFTSGLLFYTDQAALLAVLLTWKYLQANRLGLAALVRSM
jgi:alpha-1,2-glucosyltransferase